MNAKDMTRIFLIIGLVYTALVIETVQVCFNGADMFHWFAAGYGNVIMLNEVNFSPFDTPMLGAAIAFMVQLFFAYRIWSLKKSYLWISIIIGLARGFRTIHNRHLTVL